MNQTYYQPNQQPQTTQRVVQAKKKRRFPKIFWVLLVLFLILFGMVFAKVYSLSSSVFVGESSFFKRITGIAFNSNSTRLIGEDQDQINILLLGYGGEGHDGPYLTDSILVASIKPSERKVLLSSLPRDYSANPNVYNDDQKINSVFAYTLTEKQDFASAGADTRQAIERITGLSVPYFASIDFAGFEKAIDQVGGIEVTIDRTFTDSTFPNTKLGYLPAITFTKGVEQMNGTRALQFARSRHGNNNEGSDFARSIRQQKIIEAFKNKIQTLNLKDAGTISQLVNTLSDHFHTNLEPSELLRLAELMNNKEATTTPVTIASQSLGTQIDLLCEKYPRPIQTTPVITPTTGSTKPTSNSSTTNNSTVKNPTPASGIKPTTSTNTGTTSNTTPSTNTPETPSNTTKPTPEPVKPFVLIPCNSEAARQIQAFFTGGFIAAELRDESATIILENAGTNYQKYAEIKAKLENAGITVYEVTYRGLPLSETVFYQVNPKPKTIQYIEKELNVTIQPKPEAMKASSDLVLIFAE